jgi:Flp pilus assembly protein TadD
VRYVDSGLHRSATDYAGAVRDLDSAASFDPLAPEPHYAAGGIALDHRRYADARHAFEQALETEDGWYPHFELALLDARQKRFRAARREIALAHALNPPDLLVLKAVTLISQGKRVDPRAVDRKALALPLYKDPRHQ